MIRQTYKYRKKDKTLHRYEYSEYNASLLEYRVMLHHNIAMVITDLICDESDKELTLYNKKMSVLSAFAPGSLKISAEWDPFIYIWVLYLETRYK